MCVVILFHLYNILCPLQWLHGEATISSWTRGHLGVSDDLGGPFLVVCSGRDGEGGARPTPSPTSSLVSSRFSALGPRLTPSSLTIPQVIQAHRFSPRTSIGLTPLLLSKLFTSAMSRRFSLSLIPSLKLPSLIPTHGVPSPLHSSPRECKFPKDF